MLSASQKSPPLGCSVSLESLYLGRFLVLGRFAVRLRFGVAITRPDREQCCVGCPQEPLSVEAIDSRRVVVPRVRGDRGGTIRAELRIKQPMNASAHYATARQNVGMHKRVTTWQEGLWVRFTFQ
jgi:hypothetical protein